MNKQSPFRAWLERLWVVYVYHYWSEEGWKTVKNHRG